MAERRSTQTRADENTFPEGRRKRLHHVRRRILRSTDLLPAMFTMLNGIAGFASIHYATREAVGEARLEHLALAAWLILAAMVCDMLDGRLARMTRRTSDFGGQLDSICDVISFGVAPAVLVVRTSTAVLRGQVESLTFLPNLPVLERLIWCVAAIYVACAALRLARFNVETEDHATGHLRFTGLPTPGAAAVTLTLTLLLVHLEGTGKSWLSGAWPVGIVAVLLPATMVATALLMVSRVPYPHLLNQYLHAKRPFGTLVKLVIITVAALVELFVTAALVAMIYVAAGPVRVLLGRRFRRGAEAGEQ
ncbi:MAG: CDP-diacylglycerol--serine O-phosphatidyltransferase [Phycisphaerae bacterium]